MLWSTCLARFTGTKDLLLWTTAVDALTTRAVYRVLTRAALTVNRRATIPSERHTVPSYVTPSLLHLAPTRFAHRYTAAPLPPFQIPNITNEQDKVCIILQACSLYHHSVTPYPKGNYHKPPLAPSGPPLRTPFPLRPRFDPSPRPPWRLPPPNGALVPSWLRGSTIPRACCRPRPRPVASCRWFIGIVGRGWDRGCTGCCCWTPV